MVVTKHAYDRAKERLSLTKASLDKIANRALESGVNASAFKLGSFRRYLDGLYHKYRKANNIRIYGDVIFFFKNELLITLYQLPNEFKKAVNKVVSRNGEE